MPDPLTPEALDTIEAGKAEAERIWPVDRKYDQTQLNATFTVQNVEAYSVSAFIAGVRFAVEREQVELRRLRTENEEQRERNAGFRQLAGAAGNRRLGLHDSVAEALSRGIDHMPECYAWSDMNQSECTCGVAILRAALTGEATPETKPDPRCTYEFPIPSWAGEDQIDPCRCTLLADHEGRDHSCSHVTGEVGNVRD